MAATSDSDEQKLVYSLNGQGIDVDNAINSKFEINQTTGEIYVRKVGYCSFLKRFIRHVGNLIDSI